MVAKHVNTMLILTMVFQPKTGRNNALNNMLAPTPIISTKGKINPAKNPATINEA